MLLCNSAKKKLELAEMCINQWFFKNLREFTVRGCYAEVWILLLTAQISTIYFLPTLSEENQRKPRTMSLIITPGRATEICWSAIHRNGFRLIFDVSNLAIFHQAGLRVLGRWLISGCRQRTPKTSIGGSTVCFSVGGRRGGSRLLTLRTTARLPTTPVSGSSTGRGTGGGRDFVAGDVGELFPREEDRKNSDTFW